ncbi:MAG: efflux RND transporter periplasmic adaptor subunit [Bacteroidota bacterium]|nr:efflux RND transporter periplasmic adaptor subunit [Bacteroidota bacterium]
MKKILIPFMIAGVALIFGCTPKNKQEAAKAEVYVTTVKSTEVSYIPSLTLSGSVKAFQEASLGATLPGRVEKLYFHEGSDVKKGALIAELSGELLTQAEVENDALQKDFDRISRLQEKGSISKMEYDHLKAKLDASNAKVKMMRKNTQVIAPFPGTVVEVNIHEGENFSLVPSVDAQNMTVSNGIVKLMQLDPVKVCIEVGEKDLQGVRIGQKVSITADAYQGKTFEGKINYIKPFLSPTSRTATVEVLVNNPGHTLKPGMYASTSIEMPGTTGIAVPISCIYRQPGTANEYVFTLVNGTAHRNPIKQLQTLNDKVIVDGINADQEIINAGKARIEEGMHVTVKNN